MIQTLQWWARDINVIEDVDEGHVVGEFKYNCPICGECWLKCHNRSHAKDWDFFSKICPDCGDGRVGIGMHHSARVPNTFPYEIVRREFLLYSDPDWNTKFREFETWHTWTRPL